MGETTAQAAEGMSAEDVDRARDALRLDWGRHYLTGYSTALGWWATQHGETGRVITADSPDGLRAAMDEDHGPVRQ